MIVARIGQPAPVIHGASFVHVLVLKLLTAWLSAIPAIGSARIAVIVNPIMSACISALQAFRSVVVLKCHARFYEPVKGDSPIAALIAGAADLPPLRYSVEKRAKPSGDWHEHADWGADSEGAFRSARYYRALTFRAFDWRVCVRCGDASSVLLGEGGNV